jgi:regulatory protein
VNDKVFADIKATGLRRAGKSRRVITQKLAAKGVTKALIDEAMGGADEGMEPEDAEMKAALSFAKKKRLGTFRKVDLASLSREASLKLRQKELAAMARAGFALDVARKVLKAKDLEEFLED